MATAVVWNKLIRSHAVFKHSFLHHNAPSLRHNALIFVFFGGQHLKLLASSQRTPAHAATREIQGENALAVTRKILTAHIMPAVRIIFTLLHVDVTILYS